MLTLINHSNSVPMSALFNMAQGKLSRFFNYKNPSSSASSSSSRLRTVRAKSGSLSYISSKYESLDYDTCENQLLVDEERTRGYTYVVQTDVARWFLFFLIGIFTAGLGVFTDVSIAYLADLKYNLLKHCRRIMAATGLALGCLFFVIASASAQYFELKNVNQLAEAKKFQNIVIRDLQVPAGVTLDLSNLREGTTVEFAGRVTFGYKEWRGPLVKISGKRLNIMAYDYARLDGEGHRWWKGGRLTTLVKPRFFEATVDDSTIRGLYFKNPPAWCFVCNWCHNTEISRMTVDTKDAGDGRAGRAYNTDGIGLGYVKNVTVLDSYIYNQDDCFVTGGGEDILIDNLTCEGGNGIGVGSLGKGADVVRLTIRNSKVINSLTGLNIKTELNAVGLHRDVTFENIELKDIHQYGITIHGNEGPTYPNGEPSYFLLDRLTMKNIKGNMVGAGGANVWIWLHPDSAKNWKWQNVNVRGGKSAMFRPPLQCKGVPQNLGIRCAEK